MGTGPIAPIAMLAAAAVVGAVLAACGWRGRRIDRHPLCRRCGYDLVGRAPDARVCSECGADLTGRRRIRLGHRVRRPLWVVAGLVLIVPGAVHVAEIGWRHASDYDYTRHKPTAWLIGDTRATADPAARAAALGELRARLARGQLTPDHVEAIAEHATAALRTPQWSAGFATIVNDAYAAGTLPHDAWERYWRSAATVTVSPRQQVTIGDPLPFRVDVQVLNEAGPVTALRGGVLGWAVGEGAATRGAWEPLSPGRVPEDAAANARLRGRYVLPSAAPPTIPRLHAALPGPQTLWCRVELDIRLGKSGGRVRTEASAPFTLLPREQPSVELVRDPDLSAQITRGLAVSNLNRSGDGRLTCSIASASAVPGPVYYRAYLRAGGSPGTPTGAMIGRVALGPGRHTQPLRTSAPWHFAPAGPQLLLVPDPAAAAATIDVTSLPADPILVDVPQVPDPIAGGGPRPARR
jgi:hypothetical protein